MTILKSILSRLLVVSLIAAPAFAGTVTYLALGDSISFGYSPNIVPPPVSQYVGYPEIVSALLNPFQSGTLVNASCPGQSSAGFLYGAAASQTEVPGQNCEFISAQPPQLAGWKAGLPLHNSYLGTQADFAVSQLLSNKSIELVTISLGGNDLLFLQFMCGGPTAPNFAACVQIGLQAALLSYGNNLGTTLTRIRQEAMYTGTIVLVKYFATSTDPLVKQAIGALNLAMEQVASNFPGVKLADAYTAFQIASKPYGGDPCKAGLLVPLSTGGCDIHPTFAGQDLLAATVLQALNLPALTSGNNCNGTYYGTFKGNLNVSNHQTCILVGGGVTGNITQNGGSLGIGNVTIGGNVQVNGGGPFSVGPAAIINGNLQIQNDPAGMASSQVCGSTVTGDLQFHNNGSPVVIGWAAPWCVGNVIGGNLEVHNNTASIAILNNTVGGNVQVQNNTASTQVFNNIVKKDLQCQNNSPATTGGGNTAAHKQGQCSAF